MFRWTNYLFSWRFQSTTNQLAIQQSPKNIRSIECLWNSLWSMVCTNLSGIQRDMRISSILLFQMILSSSRQLSFLSHLTSNHNVISFRSNIPLSGCSYNQFSKVAPYDFLRVNYYNLHKASSIHL